MEPISSGIIFVCVGLWAFLAFGLKSSLVAFADAKVKTSENLFKIEQEKTKQSEANLAAESYKLERARIENLQ